MRILIIEDHADSSEVMSRLLSSSGHEVVMTDSVTHAEDLCGAEPFDILICDLMLPDKDGWGLAQVAAQQGIPAIAVTGLGQPEDITRTRQAGFAAHLLKPVTFGDLERTLYEVARTYIPQQVAGGCLSI